jgi:aminopeptidase YwaD
VLAMSLIQLAGLVFDSPGLVHTGTLGWVLLVYPITPSIIFVLFFTRGRQDGGSVPGAADNLSGCALAVAMCRFLVRNPSYIPDDTEIRFITFGSEEAGYRGSRRYVARHLDELKRLDVRLLNFDTLAHPEIAILTSETNGTVKNSPDMVKSLAAAAQRLGIPYNVQPATLGTASDAGPFSRAGLKAVTLLGMKVQQMVAFYHQKGDNPEVLTIAPLFNVLKLSLEWLRCNGE